VRFVAFPATEYDEVDPADSPRKLHHTIWRGLKPLSVQYMFHWVTSVRTQAEVSVRVTDGCASTHSLKHTSIILAINFAWRDVIAQSVYRQGYGLHDWGSRVRFPERAGNFLLTTASRTVLRPTQPPIQWAPGALASGVKRPGREANHSPPSSAEVKNAWNYASTPLIRLHGVELSLKKHRDNFNFISFIWNILTK
jgi:hypothetical protein